MIDKQISSRREESEERKRREKGEREGKNDEKPESEWRLLSPESEKRKRMWAGNNEHTFRPRRATESYFIII